LGCSIAAVGTRQSSVQREDLKREPQASAPWGRPDRSPPVCDHPCQPCPGPSPIQTVSPFPIPVLTRPALSSPIQGNGPEPLFCCGLHAQRHERVRTFLHGPSGLLDLGGSWPWAAVSKRYSLGIHPVSTRFSPGLALPGNRSIHTRPAPERSAFSGSAPAACPASQPPRLPIAPLAAPHFWLASARPPAQIPAEIRLPPPLRSLPAPR
jgi:hypothetical protein